MDHSWLAIAAIIVNVVVVSGVVILLYPFARRLGGVTVSAAELRDAMDEIRGELASLREDVNGLSRSVGASSQLPGGGQERELHRPAAADGEG